MVTIEKSREECLARFGFSFERGGAHLARSMMLDEISQLFQHQVDHASQRSDYESAVLDDNCLGKRSARSRQLTLRHLKSLYLRHRMLPDLIKWIIGHFRFIGIIRE
jgi:hypothetical protein